MLKLCDLFVKTSLLCFQILDHCGETLDSLLCFLDVMVQRFEGLLGTGNLLFQVSTFLGQITLVVLI